MTTTGDCDCEFAGVFKIAGICRGSDERSAANETASIFSVACVLIWETPTAAIASTYIVAAC